MAMFPLMSAELPSDLWLSKALRFGTLPMAFDADDPVPYLMSYAETYLEQEVRAEALTRDFGGFAGFLEIAARQNAQMTNATAIARDPGVARTTVQATSRF